MSNSDALATNHVSMNQINIIPLSENSVLVQWPEQVCLKQHQEILCCQLHINHLLAENLIDSIAAYNSLIIYYQFDMLSSVALHAILNKALKLSQNQPSHSPSHKSQPITDESTTSSLNSDVVDIPVYYGADAGWDILDVANQLSLSVDEVIQKHSQQIYRAFALGFSPGFCYLGVVDSTLQLPRRKSPRIHVPTGAVAIAEQQTAVYPSSSPGGWHIIGQTPLAMFEASDNAFIPLIKVGQQVRFYAISYQEFCQQHGKVVQEER